MYVRRHACVSSQTFTALTCLQSCWPVVSEGSIASVAETPHNSVHRSTARVLLLVLLSPSEPMSCITAKFIDVCKPVTSCLRERCTVSLCVNCGVGLVC